ncbi:hypothetical protein L6164_031707 [Bauhinia variegata]|uniref:Uncharacterized protein n=1 Tax=Bauhinia variegata TaxID=167791 RepID=A0ACB9LFT4_BAUVA|nr:hypothetical protein L6164_031707 [Bauhinia variegata]
MAQAVSSLRYFMLGHYMKIPPRSMFLVQLKIYPMMNCYLQPNSPWKCPGDRIFFDDASDLIVWLLQKAFLNQKWICFIHLPVLFGSTASMPPATTVNFNSWIVVGTTFNYFIFKYQKWWQRSHYVLSAAVDAGLAFMGVVFCVALTMENRSVTWWGVRWWALSAVHVSDSKSYSC